MPPSRASNMSSYPNQGPSRRLGWPMKPNPGSARAATGAPVMRPILACLSAASAWTVASTMVTRAWNAGLVGASLPMICGPLLDRPPDIDEAVSLRVTSRPSPAFSPISHQKLGLALDTRQADALDKQTLRQEKQDHHRQHEDHARSHQVRPLGLMQREVVEQAKRQRELRFLRDKQARRNEVRPGADERKNTHGCDGRPRQGQDDARENLKLGCPIDDCRFGQLAG